MDVSLCTSIFNADGLTALKHYLDQRTNPDIPTSVFLRLIELVFTLNSFEFNGEHYPHTSGIVMGTNVGPAFACLLMGFLEERILQVYHGYIPLMYIRYIDDGYGISDRPEADVISFLDFLL
jgi:hypothetical protein